jgi:hypothetical protein
VCGRCDQVLDTTTGQKDGRRTFAGLPGPTDGFDDHTVPLRLKEEVHRNASRMDVAFDRDGPSVISTGADLEAGSSCDMMCPVVRIRSADNDMP